MPQNPPEAGDGATDRNTIGSDHADGLELRVLGSVSVAVHGVALSLTPVEQSLVALLVASGPPGLDTDRLADQLWPNEMPATWRAALRNAVSRLNRKVSELHETEARLIADGGQRQLLVDETAIDQWRLQAWASSPENVGIELVRGDPLLLSGSPFPGCELSPLLRKAVQSVEADRRDIIEFWSRQGEQLSNRVLVDLRQVLSDDPFNNSLAESVVGLHLAAGAHDEARKLLDDIAAETPLTESLTELRDKLDQQHRPRDLDPASRRATLAIHSPSVNQLRDGPFVGRTDLLANLLADADGADTAGFLIHGEGGIGKTRLAAELAWSLGRQDHHTAYLVADRQIFGSLQPFLNAFPELGPRIRPYLSNLNDQSGQAVCRHEILSFLAETYRGRPLCLVVDDAHWLDDQSSGLVMSLARAGLADGLLIVGVGRSGDTTSRWPGWRSDLARAGLAQIPVRPLELDEMVEMIRAVHHDIGRAGANGLAQQLLELSSGIPGVAQWLLDRVDAKTMTVSVDEVAGTGYEVMVNNLEPELRYCGAIASVLGRQFEAGDLATLLERSPRALIGGDDIESCLEQLADVGLVMALASPGAYRFAHVLAAEAFGQAVPERERVEHHAVAFELFDQPIRRARHAEAAAPAVGSPRAAASLVAAARLHFNEGHYGAAVAALATADELDGSALTFNDRVLLVECLERTGVRAGEQRQRLVTRAVEDGDMLAAFTAAMTGLPDAEALEGDDERVMVFGRIDAEQLPVDRRVEYHVQFCRQLLLAARPAEARRQAALAAESASTPDQVAEAWLARRFVGGAGQPIDPADPHPPITGIGSNSLQLRVGQEVAVDAIATGASSKRWDIILGHADRSAAYPFPVQTWFSKMVLATAHSDRGDLRATKLAAAEARQFGNRAGIRVADGTYLTQYFVWEQIGRRHHTLYSQMRDGSSDDVSANIIYSAALAACHVAYAQAPANEGDGSEIQPAHGRVRQVCREVETNHLAISALGIMADAITDTGDADLIDGAFDRLSARADAYLLVASGAANLGPCRRVMAKLAHDSSTRLDLLEQARQQADDDELALWQVMTRLDLIDELDGHDPRVQTLRNQTEKLASTIWLQQLIHGRTAH